MKDKAKGFARKFSAFIYPVTLQKNKLAGAGVINPAVNDGKRRALSITGILLTGMLRRWFFALVYVLLPAVFMSMFRPGLKDSYEVTVVYLWFWMIAIREGLVYTKVLEVDENDRILLRSFNIKYGDSFIGKFLYRISTEFVWHLIILLIFRVSIYHTICLCLLTVFFRIIGEKRELKRYQKYDRIDFVDRASKKRLIQIVCIAAAYIFPLAVGIMADGWFWLIHPLPLAFVAAKALLDLRYVLKYKNYDFIASEVLDRGII